MFAVIGEALIDVVHAVGRDPVEHVGGSPANVALGLARLRAPVQLITAVGDDPRGARIRDTLAAAGVGLRTMRTHRGPTSTATAHLDDAGRATYDFDLRWDPGPIELPDGARIVHTGSLATVVEPGASAVRALLRTIGDSRLMSYDPNCRPAVMGSPDRVRGGVEELVGLAHLVKVSDEDLAWLYPGEPYDEVARRWLRGRGGVIVVTRGGDGVWAVGPGGEVGEPAPLVDVIDTVGAGDSFTAAMLHGLALVGATTPSALAHLDEPALRTVLHRAVVAAAVTCTRAGANPPDTAELAAALAGSA